VDFENLMQRAIWQAKLSGSDVPVGAVLVDSDGKIVAASYNQKEKHSDATSHAEIEVIRAAGKVLGDWRLQDMTLVVTLEPCVMCAGAIVAARIPRVVFGAWDVKVGAAGSAYDILRDPRLGNPVEVVGGVLERKCSDLLGDFFEAQRQTRD
jgi:tRNA(adenine34) deaminase